MRTAKEKGTPFIEASLKAIEQWDKFYMKIHALQERGELLFVEALKIAEKGGNEREINEAYGSYVSFLFGNGHDGRADKLLQEWIARFPNSNEARMSAATYLWYTRWQGKKALGQLNKIKLPKDPDSSDIETYYYAQELKGQVLLEEKKEKAAAKQMRLLADFTEANFDDIRFFFELRFVTLMVRAGIALEDCRRYLKTLQRRKQVEHDQKATEKLLRETAKATRKSSQRA